MRKALIVFAAACACACRAHGPVSDASDPLPKRPAAFYRELIENECSATKDKAEMNCCIESVRRMEAFGCEPLPPQADRCPKGERVWSKGCAGSMRWCAPAR